MEWWGDSFQFSQPWTPAKIATALWLDASDSATIVTVSGGVSQWLDKSGNARHATQSTATSRPTNTANTINSLPVVTFDGVDDFMDVVSTLLQGQTQINIFYVFSSYGPGTGYDAYKPVVTPLDINNANQGAFHYVKYTSKLGASYPFVFNFTPYWASYDLSSGAAYADNVPEIIGFNALSTTWRVYRNGTQEGNDGSVGMAPPSFINGLRLAQQQEPVRSSNIGIGELVVAFGLADAQRQIVEGYLAHKWGLVTRLPSGHPYKSAPPYA